MCVCLHEPHISNVSFFGRKYSLFYQIDLCQIQVILKVCEYVWRNWTKQTDKQVSDIINLERHPPIEGTPLLGPGSTSGQLALNLQPNPTRHNNICFNKEIVVQLKHASTHVCVFPGDFL